MKETARRALRLAAPLLLAACASAPDPESPPVEGAVAEAEVRAVRAPDSIIVDGRASEEAWTRAPETVVALEGVAGPSSCRVKAVVHRGTLFLLVRWEDPTEDRVHKPRVAAPGGGWTAGPEREDVLAVAFALEGPFTANMLSPVDAAWDVWHWKAGRTDPSGHAMDRTHRMTLEDPGGKRHAQALPDGTTVYITRPEDAGDGVTRELPEPPAGAPSPSPRYEAAAPSGSAGDVLARGTWNAGTWTVELARALRTGHPDDRDLESAGGLDVPFALAILDRAEDEDHAASGMLLLRLPSWERPYFDPGEYLVRPGSGYPGEDWRGSGRGR